MNMNVNIPPRTTPPHHQTKTEKHKKHIQKKDQKKTPKRQQNTQKTTKHPGALQRPWQLIQFITMFVVLTWYYMV